MWIPRRVSVEQEPHFALAENGDPLVMMETVKRCKEHNIKVGAHPGLLDRQGFGRREIKLSPEEPEANTRYQVGVLKGFLGHEGVPLHHVKPHGILYGMMCRDYEVAEAVMLGSRFRVPRSQCTKNSIEWLARGSSTSTPTAAAHGGSASRNPSVSAP